MLTLTVDFNALANGCVRGLQEDVTGTGEPNNGALVLLVDGEGNEAMGTLGEIRDGLVFAAVDWRTFGPSGRIRIYEFGNSPAPVPTTGPSVTKDDDANVAVGGGSAPDVAGAELQLV